ncbi:hypothetical protein L3Q72_08745 [Vibrio sp. JC009]|uniref:ABC transporter substrate-binding protein n=1 Tax=Vibrio sp. JC009 TaxID=2912314 RepID=UPI0023B1FDA3|nr:ABC transporter substrate binding protein [Vibrio sp. JC009]WED20731.1 hypothetical protein L3Q72_08745 [Vibrio sp. JC009]
MSYHSSWAWNVDQFTGFKDGLGDLDVEYKVVELDTKRDSSPEAIEAKVAEAKKLISAWKPDLLYTNDDNAQKYLAQDYANTSLPIVFSGVNRDPSEYGFLGAKNVTGVMEQEHFIPSVNLLRSLKKDIRKIAVVIDTGPTWKGVVTRMRAGVKHIDDMEITDWILARTLSDYKEQILNLQGKVDAIALLGIFNIKDEQGNDVDYEEILKWTAENSQLPDFSYWETRVERGTLCAVTVSGYEQGYLAGQMGHQILKEGVSPADIGMRPSDKGQPMISLRRAKALGIMPDVELLLNNMVKKDYAWDN